jgi:DNA-binding transcriptional LysR family regulator
MVADASTSGLHNWCGNDLDKRGNKWHSSFHKWDDKPVTDLNAYYLFAEVVRFEGFAAASRSVGLPKSTLSRRVAALERDLGVRLLERSSRRFRVTDIGLEVYVQSRQMISAAEAARALVDSARTEPSGLVRVACPMGLMEAGVARLLRRYLAAHPKVELQLLVTNRRVDLIEERVDLAFRVRTALEDDNSLIVRPLAETRRFLMASPEVAAGCEGQSLAEALGQMPVIAMGDGFPGDRAGGFRWELRDDSGVAQSFKVFPRLMSGDLTVLKDAVAAGLGIGLLPDHIGRDALEAGDLRRIYPDWSAPEGLIHLVYTARRGLPVGVRCLIDYIAANFDL